jgi:hypothetical protein
VCFQVGFGFGKKKIAWHLWFMHYHFWAAETSLPDHACLFSNALDGPILMDVQHVS